MAIQCMGVEEGGETMLQAPWTPHLVTQDCHLRPLCPQRRTVQAGQKAAHYLVTRPFHVGSAEPGSGVSD